MLASALAVAGWVAMADRYNAARDYQFAAPGEPPADARPSSPGSRVP